jgi:peroxiredoxin 5
MSINVGDAIPSATLHENSPGTKHETAALFGQGKHLLFGVPGAFTPGCSNTHLPGYLADFDKWQSKGIASINCISVNDAFVMAAWGADKSVGDKVRMLADPAGAFVSAMGLDVNAAALGGLRSKRFAMIIDGGKVTHLQVEPDGFGLSCSLSPALIESV